MCIRDSYYVICDRKLWLYSHRIQLEKESDRVGLGRLLHDSSYERERRRELLIDDLIKIDVLESTGKVVEIKHSRKFREAARLQVLYYLYYLKHHGIEGLVGELRFPKQRRREEVHLTREGEVEVERALCEIDQIKSSPTPPPGTWSGTCRPCAYAEFCWG